MIEAAALSMLSGSIGSMAPSGAGLQTMGKIMGLVGKENNLPGYSATISFVASHTSGFCNSIEHFESFLLFFEVSSIHSVGEIKHQQLRKKNLKKEPYYNGE